MSHAKVLIHTMLTNFGVNQHIGHSVSRLKGYHPRKIMKAASCPLSCYIQGCPLGVSLAMRVPLQIDRCKLLRTDVVSRSSESVLPCGRTRPRVLMVCSAVIRNTALYLIS